MADIKPGLHIEFFFRADYEKEKVHAENSLLYDVSGSKMVMAHPSSRLLKSSLGKDIIVTYLAKEEGRPARFGFPAKITGLIEDYEIASGNLVPAVAIQQERPPRPLNVRFAFRLRLPPTDELSLRIRGEKVDLVDISLGGAMISGMTAKGLHAQDRVRITMVIDTREYDLDATVVRVWSSAHREKCYVCPYMSALKFIDSPHEFENVLGKKILSLERKLLARDTIVR